MENSVYGDKLEKHGDKYNGRNYKEERGTVIKGTRYSYYYITRVYYDYVESILQKISSNVTPDVLVINSCLWDVTRWGPNGVEMYKKNMKTLLTQLKKCLPDCLVIWTTTPPVAAEMKGGFLVKELQFLKYSVRFHVMEANHYARQVVVSHGFDVLDVHYHLQLQIHRRGGDGIHWLPHSVRYVTNLLLTHISLAWGIALPHRYQSSMTEKALTVVDTETALSVIKKENCFKKDVIKSKLPVNVDSSSRKTKSKNNSKENESTLNIPKKRRRTPRRNKAKESHHAFRSRMEHVERHKRIRQWQPSVTAQNHYHYPTVAPRFYQNSPIYSPYSSPVPHSPYFSSDHLPYPSPVIHSPSPYSSPDNSPYNTPERHRPTLRSVILRRMVSQSPSLLPLPVEPYPFENFTPVINFTSTSPVPFGPLF